MSSLFIDAVYSVAVATIKFDDSWVNYNRRYTEIEYTSIKTSIETTGQIDPIYINSVTGLCEDGRTRWQICKELGRDIKCQLIDGTLDVGTRRDIYMRNQTVREYNDPQKAIQAYQYMLLTKCKTAVAVNKHKSSARLVNCVVKLAGLNRMDIVEAIKETGKWQGSTSLRSIVDKLEQEIEVIIIEYSDTKHIDYLDLINTAKARDDYYKVLTSVENGPHELRMLVVNYLNYKYKLVVDPETGEVTTSP